MSDLSHASPVAGHPAISRRVGRERPRLGTLVVPAIAIVMMAAACWRIRLSLDRILGLDELYTMTLIGSDGLVRMWDAAIRGVDGNPPLYLTIAWALTHALPFAPEPVLRLFNLALMAGVAAMLYGILRRIADPASAALGLASFCFVSVGPAYALPELRTYALYLLLSAATLRSTLTVVERPTGAHVAGLAFLGSLTALAHSFGGFYALTTIGAAGIVALAGRRRGHLLALAVAAAPVLTITLIWIEKSMPFQLATATPYGWILPPDVSKLLLTVTGSFQVSVLALVFVPILMVKNGLGWRKLSRRAVEDPVAATLYASLAGYAALTVAGWVGSHVITPFFSYRYFIPDLMVGAALVTLVLARLRRSTPAALQFAAALLLVALGAHEVVAGGIDYRLATPCLDGDGRFLEAGAADGTLPLIAESPHSWMPRHAYAPGRQILYPLDWEVVLQYPYKARNNAMDYHIMDILRDDADPGSAFATDVLPTERILAQHDEFLVLNEKGRSWFDHLRATVPLRADLVKEGYACKLWRVRLTNRHSG